MPPQKTYPPFSSADIVAIGYFHEREEGETERDRDRDMHYSVHNSQSTEEGQMPGVLRAPSSENDGLRRKFSRRTHNPVSLCDQVRKKKKHCICQITVALPKERLNVATSGWKGLHE